MWRAFLALSALFATGLLAFYLLLHNVAALPLWADGVIAGCLGAIVIQFVAPDSFTFALSVALLVGLVIGGVGWLPGALPAPETLISLMFFINLDPKNPGKIPFTRAPLRGP